MKHKHSELIHAWADGAIIEEYRINLDLWIEPKPYPVWDVRFQYRIKPEPIQKEEYYPEDTFDKKYLYVYNDANRRESWMSPTFIHETYGWNYMGKVEVVK